MATMVGRHDHRLQPQRRGLGQARVQASHAPDLAPEPDLADDGARGWQRAIELGSGDGQRNREVRRRVIQADPAHGVDEHVRLPQSNVGALFQHRQQKVKAVDVEPGHGAPGQRGLRADRQRLDLDGERPDALTGDRERVPRDAGAGAVHERAARGIELADAGGFHRQQAHLAGRTKTILDATEDPLVAKAIPFEIEDNVDQVFQGARSGDGSVLGDVTHKQHCDAAPLGCCHQAGDGGAHLRRTPRAPGNPAVVDGLHGVDDRQRGSPTLDCGQHRVEVGLDQQLDPSRRAPGAPSPQPHLGTRLLAGAVQRGRARPGGAIRDLQSQGGLAHTRVASEEDHRRRHDSATQHAIHLGVAGRQPPAVGGGVGQQHHVPDSGGQLLLMSAGQRLLAEAVPLLTLRAATLPAG
jgi:hypothetical protein